MFNDFSKAFFLQFRNSKGPDSKLSKNHIYFVQYKLQCTNYFILHC